MLKISTFLVCLLLSFFSFSQDCGLVVRKIDMGGNEDIWHTATSKDGYVFVAGTSFRPAGIQAGILLKTDTLGNVIWTRAIAGTGLQNFRKIIPTKDSGCITVGNSSNLPSTFNFSGWAIKWDKNGLRQWSRSLSTTSFNGDWILGGIETSDGGYLFTGLQNAAGWAAYAVALKTDKGGTAQWIKLYDIPEGFEYQGANEVSDGYVLCGEYLYNSNTSYRPIITKINKTDGGVISNVTYTYNNGILVTNGALIGRPGGYFLNMAVLANLSGTGSFRHVVSYIDSGFNVEKTVAITYPNAKTQSNIVDLVATPDGGFVAGLGGLRTGNDADLYKIGADGQLTWKQKFGGTGSQHISGVTGIGSDNYVFAGSTEHNGTERDILWIRTYIGSNTTDCGFTGSDATAVNIAITKASFSLWGEFNIDLSNWKTFTPIIESNVYTVSYTCGYDCSNKVLPLKIRSITADKIAGKAVINWVTENEASVAQISLQRSTNGTEFQEVQKIIPKGAVTNQYAFVDQDIPTGAGVLFYRVEIIHQDGKSTFSKVVYISLDGSGEFVQIIPNPNRGSFSLQVYSKEAAESVNLSIYDQSGRAISTQKVSLKKGNNAVFVDLNPALQSGIYLLSISGNNRNEVKKLYIRK